MKRPLLFLAIYLSAGIFFSHVLSLSYASVLWPLGFIGLIAFPFLNRSRIFVLCGLFFYLGFLLYQYHVYFPPADRIDQFDGIKKEIGLRGEIIDFIEILGVPHCILKISQLQSDRIKWKDCQGNVLVRLSDEEDFQNELFDRIELTADVMDLPMKDRYKSRGFYTWFLAHEISMTVKSYVHQIKIWKEKPFVERIIISFKNFCAENLKKGLPPDSEAKSLLGAMLLGERADFPPSLKNAFLYTNTIHILSISGLHLTIILIAMLFVFGFFPISRNWVRGMTLIGIWFYAVMTVLRPPILRSALMASFFLAGSMLRKKVDLANVLGASALAMLLVNPLQLFDPGFQLSFLCLLALIFLSPMVEKDFSFLKDSKDEWKFQRNWKDRMMMSFRKNLILLSSGSFAVWVGVLPLVAYHFRIFSPITVLANLLAVPLVGVIMNIGFATCLLGRAYWISAPLNAVNQIMVDVMAFLLRGISKLPGAYFYVERPTVVWMTMFYCIVLAGYFQSRRKGRFTGFSAMAILSVVLLGDFNFKEVLKLKFYETDQFFMTLAESSNGNDLRVNQLKDAKGYLPEKKKNILGWRLPQVFKVKRLNHVFLEHSDQKFERSIVDIFPGVKFQNLEESGRNKDKNSCSGIRFKNVVIHLWDASAIYPGTAEEKDLFNILVIAENIRYESARLDVLDQIPNLMIILGENINKKIAGDVRARKIPCLELKKGKPFCLETDGEKVWRIED